MSYESRQILQLPGYPGRLAFHPTPEKKHNTGMLCLGIGWEDGPNRLRNLSCSGYLISSFLGNSTKYLGNFPG